ncbi:MAG: phospholipase [Sphingobacteriales bacterium]|nr:phospholipase [Sphingobacteriales bacterium]
MSRLRKLIHMGYSPRNRVQLVQGGAAYFKKLESLIEKATQCIHLQFYIFLADETGQNVISSLKDAAAKGVAVYLQLDAYASQGLPQKTVNELREAGVQVKWFESLFKSRHFYFGRRMHHKVVVVDGCYALVGGNNICNRYNDMPGEPAWLDMAVYCEGEASYVVYHICRRMWGEKIRTPVVHWKTIDAFCATIPAAEYTDVRVRQNDWVKRKVQVWRSYLEVFNKAENELLIMCSYFLPGILYRRKLAQAVKRGVTVKVVLAGISDIRIAKHAERFLYDWMLKNQIAIYEYQETVLHAKVATCDNSWTTVGSYNVNNISAYASLELNLDIRDRNFALHTRGIIYQIISNHCKEITRENYRSSAHLLRRAWQRICYGFFNTVLKLFTFYFRQE